ncbi:right-handed parallel beta-helix repeat-containing protein [Actinomadura rubrisoli]|uniref:Right-handed parallel beta-helix repeat-containing protein n=2 Tax=Actinomadura rubrisoli TaxID=2530368 RepID=A0A4R5AR15_9ACTN|nr:right-handed parallel beta-helix repeat-containing protein [Actinomadura rubrisoli]
MGPDAAASVTEGSEQLYVAPWGKDSWPGTADRPFATPARAQQAVRAKTPRMTSDIVVNLRAGTYALTAPLKMSASAGDSGRNGHRVVYQAYGYGTGAQERVTLSGGRAVSGWRTDRGIWRADVGELDTRQLFVNGRRAGRTSMGAGLPGKVTKTKSGYVTDSAAPLSWKRPQDIELVYTLATGYSEGRCGVAGITAGPKNKTTITMDQPCFRRANQIYGEIADPPGLIPPNDVQNSPSFLRKPGSWYLDRSRPGHHELLYLPRPGEDPRRADVVAPVLESLVSGEGTAKAPLHDVALRGLTFAHCTWRAPSRPAGFPHIIGTWYYVGEDPKQEKSAGIPGAVAFRAAARVTVEGNHFTRLGTQALELSHGASASVVRGNVIEDVSGGGVHIGAIAEEPGTYRDNRVENNWVHHVGIDYHGGWGILLNQPHGSTVAHNQVNDVPYSGIVFLNSGGDAKTADRTRVLNNRVFNAGKVLLDGGGIYSNGPQGPSFAAGAVISGNEVHDTTNPYAENDEPPYAIYTDDGGDRITVESNVIYRNQHPLGGVEPRRVRFIGNFWDDPRPIWWGPSKEVQIKGNTLLSNDRPQQACQASPACARILAGAGLQPAFRGLLQIR